MKLALSALFFAAASVVGQVITTEVIQSNDRAWTRHTIDASSRGADGVKLGDFNGDGMLDIVTGWEEGGKVRVCVNPGPAMVRAQWPSTEVGTAADVEEAIFTDLDGDGHLEVVSATEGDTRTVFWHRQVNGIWRQDAFPAVKGAQMWMQAITLDLDGLHGPDLILGSKNKGASLGWMQAPAQASDLGSWRFHRIADAGWLMSLIPVDLDDDGDQDVLFTDRKGSRRGVFWAENPGAVRVREFAPWSLHVIGAADREVMFADVGDLNADGLQDLVVAAKPHDILVFLRRPDGTWGETCLTLHSDATGDAKAVKMGDLTGDGLADLVFSCENALGLREGVLWLEQRRNGPWIQHALGGPEGVKFDLIQLLDLDADGDLDVITCEERALLGVVWYENPQS